MRLLNAMVVSLPQANGLGQWLAFMVMAAAPFAASADQASAYQVNVVADRLEHPWSVAFLPDSQTLLVTERPGRLRVVEQGELRVEPVSGLPEVFASGQAGLFDVLLSGDFATSRVIYLSFAHGTKDANHVRIVRARLDGDQLTDVTPIFTAEPAKSGDAHYGARMAWLPDGTLLMGTGDGFYFREESQNMESHLGKIIRINPDGSVPAGNPFVATAGVRPEILSYGHRNVQAIVVDSATGTTYAHEHGPRGGDELNRIQPGKNYGWPLITYGRDYVRSAISPFTALPGMEQPLVYWKPSIAPGGMTLYQGELFPAWQGSLFVAALAEESVRRLSLDASGAVVEQEVLFTEIGQRMRDVRTGPDGALYLLTDEENGQLLQVVPAR
jgi:aldose sugar dehydrogenase